MAPATDEVIAALDALRQEVECCSNCVLGSTRTKAVFGEGDPGADLMFVGEAPGYHEDQQGRPFVGQAGRLLEQLLASIGLTREQVYIANVLKSRPPNNRDPRPEEIEACRPYLFRQIEIIKPRVICTLGNFATKLLTGSPAGITRVHGQPQETEISGHRLYLYPIFHPAAALYTPSMLDTLKDDFSRLPRLLTPDSDAAPPEARASAAPRAAASGPAVPGPVVAEPAAADPTAPGPVLPRPAGPAPAESAPAGPTLEERARDALGATPLEDDPGAETGQEPAPGVSPAPAAPPEPAAAPADEPRAATPPPGLAPAGETRPAVAEPAPAREQAATGQTAEPEQLGLF